MTPEEMIAEVLDSEIEQKDGLANDLLREFHRGHPIEHLKLLIYSDLRSARSTAAFIAEELFHRAAPLLKDIATLLDHPSPRARYDALSALWKCATYNDGWAIAAALRCLEDSWPGVRKGAMDAVRLANREALLAGFKTLKSQDSTSGYARFGRAFLKAERGDNGVIEGLLSDPSPVVRRFAVGLAARPRLVVDQTRLNLASSSSEQDLAEYAAEAGDFVLPPWSSLLSLQGHNVRPKSE